MRKKWKYILTKSRNKLELSPEKKKKTQVVTQLLKLGSLVQKFYKNRNYTRQLTVCGGENGFVYTA